MLSAAELADASTQAAMAGDRAGWLALYADDAVVEDPVGPSIWDPQGQGHRGKAALAAFWDLAIAPNRGLRFELRERYPGGVDEVASVVSVHTTLPDGQPFQFGMVAVLRRNAQGLIQSLRAFWHAGP
jgi:steroid Delta-isomerase